MTTTTDTRPLASVPTFPFSMFDPVTWAKTNTASPSTSI
jgi:hypothetical protein